MDTRARASPQEYEKECYSYTMYSGGKEDADQCAAGSFALLRGGRGVAEQVIRYVSVVVSRHWQNFKNIKNVLVRVLQYYSTCTTSMLD